ncbi:MAG: histidine kinase [Dorea sp.]|nr:histidine kinase [Dorea sp.]
MELQQLIKELILNIAYLALIAEIASRIGFIQNAILEERRTLKNQMILSLFFAGIIIFSTIMSIDIGNFGLNARVIGAMSAGLLGGPLVGFTASMIGAVFVFFFSHPAIFAQSCAFATMLFGLLGAGFYPYFQRGKWQYRDLFLLAVFAEVAEMCCLVRLNVSLAVVLSVILDAAIPMILLNSVGILIFISCFNTVFVRQSIEISHQIEKMTTLSTQCISYFQNGYLEEERMRLVVTNVLDSMNWGAALIVDSAKVLASEIRVPDHREAYLAELERCGQEAIRNKTRALYDQIALPLEEGMSNQKTLNEYMLVGEPFIINNRAVGAMVVLIKKQWFGSTSELTLFSNFASLCSYQISLNELQRQESMRQKAEIKALQYQINPHFLFNALNTISYVCREDADRARELLGTLADYFRYNLGTETIMVPVVEELDHVKSYLELEHARFEEKLIVTFEFSEDLDFEIPSLILQPLVENAVRYGAGERGKRTVHISIRTEEEEHVIRVTDGGRGFPKEVLDKLESGEAVGKSIGLTNVQRRMKSIYGPEYGIHIETSDKGSIVELRIPRTEPART